MLAKKSQGKMSMDTIFDDEERENNDVSNELVVSSPGQTRVSLLAIEAELLGELARAADDFARNNVFTERQRTKALRLPPRRSARTGTRRCPIRGGSTSADR